MTPHREVSLEFSESTERGVLHEVFDVPKPASEICSSVISGGPVSTEQIADELEYDRSTVRTYLNELADAGFLEQARLNCEGGGFVNVYYRSDADVLERNITLAVYYWAMIAAATLSQSMLGNGNADAADEPSGVLWNDDG
jgi:predicted transcriptional regulator